MITARRIRLALKVLLFALAVWPIGLTPAVLAQSQSNDATLSALTLSDVDFGTFASSTSSYTATVESSVTETTVTPTTNHTGASYVIKLGGVTDDDGEVSTGVGSNVITVVVTAEDGQTTRTYTVTVTRPVSTDASISGVTLRVGTYWPYGPNLGTIYPEVAFDSDTRQYTASVGNGLVMATATPSVNHPGASYVIEFDGAEDADGEVLLSEGSNVMTIEVTAEDGEATQTYTLTVTRLENNSPTGQPTISGTAEVGETLTGDVSNIADADGINLTGISYIFNWWTDICDGYPGILAVKNVYADPSNSFLYTHLGPESEQVQIELTSYAAGYGVLLEVEYLDGGYVSEKVWSEPTDIVPGPVESLILVDTSDGSDVATLECAVSSSEAKEVVLDADGSYSIRAGLADDADVGSISWDVNRGVHRRDFASGTDNGGSHFSLFGEDAEGNLLGKGFSTEVYDVTIQAYSESYRGGDHLQQLWFKKFKVVHDTPATGAPTISGTAQVGETLTASTSGISDADGLTNVTYTYQWLADDTEIDGATSSTYLVQSTDNGKVIKVRVDFRDDASTRESLTSAGTAAVVTGGL